MKIVSISLLPLWLLCLVSCVGQERLDVQAPAVDEMAIKRILTSDDVQVGAERVEAYLPMLQGKSVAMVVNQTSAIGSSHIVDSLISRGISIKTIFAPEHGFRGHADAGELLPNGNDKKTGLPIVSLYGKSKKPTKEQLAGIDVIVFDIQDVGARFYTYISTMHFIMQACAENNIEFVVLDRPNPNGFYVDGPVLDETFQSFVGMHKIPVVHGLTVGELAQMIVGEGWIKPAPKMVVIPVEGYTHSSTYDLPIKPSPNLPNLKSILLYPSLCFFEPTSYSIGRGTDVQFQVLGRPNNEAGEFQFTPVSSPGAKHPKHEGVLCKGYDFTSVPLETLLDRKALDLSYLVDGVSADHVDRITSYTFFDKLAGTDVLRKQLGQGMSESEIRKSWEPALSQYKAMRKKYLMYPE